MLSEISFAPVKADEGLAGDCLKYESNGDIFFKRSSLIDYLDEIKKYLENIINKLKYSASSQKMNFILCLHYYYKKDDKVIEKETFIE